MTSQTAHCSLYWWQVRQDIVHCIDGKTDRTLLTVLMKSQTGHCSLYCWQVRQDIAHCIDDKSDSTLLRRLLPVCLHFSIDFWAAAGLLTSYTVGIEQQKSRQNGRMLWNVFRTQLWADVMMYQQCLFESHVRSQRLYETYFSKWKESPVQSLCYTDFHFQAVKSGRLVKLMITLEPVDIWFVPSTKVQGDWRLLYPLGNLIPTWIRNYIHYKGSSSGVVVRSTGAYEKLSGHPARPVLGWVARVEYPVPSHYTCQAAQSGYRESISWLSTCPSEET